MPYVPSIRNRAVCSKQPFVLGTLAQLSRTMQGAARTPGAHRAAVQTSVPIRNGRLERTGPIDLQCNQPYFHRRISLLIPCFILFSVTLE